MKTAFMMILIFVQKRSMREQDIHLQSREKIIIQEQFLQEIMER